MCACLLVQHQTCVGPMQEAAIKEQLKATLGLGAAPQGGGSTQGAGGASGSAGISFGGSTLENGAKPAEGGSKAAAAAQEGVQDLGVISSKRVCTLCMCLQCIALSNMHLAFWLLSLNAQWCRCDRNVKKVNCVQKRDTAATGSAAGEKKGKASKPDPSESEVENVEVAAAGTTAQ